jgi:hypothetical protein
MASICSPGCADAPITKYDPNCDILTSVRKGGLQAFILLDCDVELEDVTSVSEWNEISESLIFTSPTGLGQFTEPETTAEAVDCSPDKIVDEISGATFQIKKFDNETFLDFDMEHDLKTVGENKTVMFVDCNDILYYNRDWSVGTDNPGFAGLSLNVYRTSERGSLQVLNVNFTYNSFQTGFKAIKLTPELKAVFFG